MRGKNHMRGDARVLGGLGHGLSLADGARAGLRATGRVQGLSLADGARAGLRGSMPHGTRADTREPRVTHRFARRQALGVVVPEHCARETGNRVGRGEGEERGRECGGECAGRALGRSAEKS
jgi:hypothetical protein